MRGSPTITYDPVANVLYVRFSRGEIAETLELSESVYVDGVPIGLEVLDATPELMSELPTIPDAAALKDLMCKSAA